jgi:hypothetical protein
MDPEPIEDAVAMLEASGTPFVLLLGHDDRTIVRSSLSPEDREMLLGWIETGHWNKILLDLLGDPNAESATKESVQ